MVTARDDILAADEAVPREQKHGVRNTVEWVVIIAAAIGAALLIKQFLFQAFYIPTASMHPTLLVSDKVLVNKLSYRLHDINRGDVVVFERPPGEHGSDTEIKDLIKRVVALPGETVEGRGGQVLIDGRPLPEPYLPSGTVTGEFNPVKVAPGHIWVMGDNRSNSKDSRTFGAVDDDRVVGRAFVRIWPVSSLGFL